MLLKNLKLIQFRNHKLKTFEFSDKFNVFFGQNGAGKTNILEAINYLSLTKSIHIPKDVDNIQENTSFFRIEGTFTTKKKHFVTCIFEKGKKKKFEVNEVLVDRLADYIGKFPLVTLHPFDIDLIREGSEIRRKLIDTFLCQMDKKYFSSLLRYQKALKNRNLILKKFARNGLCNWNETSPYEQIMAKESVFIFNKRTEWMQDIAPIFNKINNQIAGKNENVLVSYQSQLLQYNLLDWFAQQKEKDFHTQRSNAGIHKDDLVFSIRGIPLKKFASQGQQKTLLLGLKIALIPLSQEKYKKYPLLLLDDLLEKLDENRTQNLLVYLNTIKKTQIFIADAMKKRALPLLSTVTKKYSIFDIDEE